MHLQGNRQGLLQPVLLQGSAPAASSASQGVLRVCCRFRQGLQALHRSRKARRFQHTQNCVQCNEYNLQDNLPNNGSGIIACRGGKCVLCVEKSTYKRVDVCHSQISFQDSFQIRFFRQFRRRKNCVRKARTLFECNKNIAKQTAFVRLCPFVPYSVMLTLSVAAVATVHKNLSATLLLLTLYTAPAVLSTPFA